MINKLLNVVLHIRERLDGLTICRKLVELLQITDIGLEETCQNLIKLLLYIMPGLRAEIDTWKIVL